MTVKTVGLDLAKDVFQVHGISGTGRKVFNKKIKRAKLLAFFETLPRCAAQRCGLSKSNLRNSRLFLRSIGRGTWLFGSARRS